MKMRDPLKIYRASIKRFKLIHAIGIFGAIVIGAITIHLSSQSVKAIDFSWIQTNWNGGISSNVINSNVTTYLSLDSLDASIEGQVEMGVTAGWWNSSWLYRKEVEINNSGSTLTDYQVKVTLNTLALTSASKIQNDCDDARFIDGNGNSLNYWLDKDTACGTVSTNFWVRFSSLPGGNTPIHFYYGNTDASAASSGDLTFDFFDDFPGSSLDSSKWSTNVVGSITGTVSSGYYQITDTVHTWMYNLGSAASQNQVKYGTGTGDNIAVEWSQNVNSTGGGMGQFGIALADNSNLIRVWAGHEDGNGADTYCTRMVYSGNGTSSGSSTCPDVSRVAMVKNGTTVKSYFNDALSQTGSSVAVTKIGMFAAGYPGYGFIPTAKYDWIFIRKSAATQPTINSTGTEEGATASSGTLTSNIFNTGLPSNLGTLSYTSAGTVTVKVRTGGNNTLSDAIAFSSCSTVISGADISANDCVDDEDQYIQYQITLSSGNAVFNDITINYSPSDAENPITNATNVLISGINSGDWLNTSATINWNIGADNIGGSGILGYCVALDLVTIAGSSSTLNPEISGGILGALDDGIDSNACPYIVDGTSLDLSAISGLTLMSGNKYYFSIKAVDLAGNVWTGASNQYQDLIWFRFDNTPPTPPNFISMPSNFISTKDVTITWPTSTGAAADSNSGLAGLQYRIGSSGIWYGNLKSGNEDLTDLLLNNGTYTTDPTVDYPLLLEGINVIYIRALDNAGNVSTQLTSGALKLNTIAPGQVQNLTATPTTNTINEYAFNWDEPSSFSGSATNLTYCYTINTLPSSNTCNYTAGGNAALSQDAFATQPGENTFYVVAKDEAGNINYATRESVTFTYSGTAPSIPLNIGIADISLKENQDWKLAVTWSTPSNEGAGVSKYKVYRATSNNLNCSSDMSSFSEVGQVLDTSYIATGLTQQYYSYCVRACDSANNCSAISGTVSDYPTGKYTSPADLVSGPNTVQISTRKAAVNWSTDRNSDSKIQYGKSSNNYLEEEVSKSNQVTEHVITLNNLEPGTVYYYRSKWTDEDGNTGTSAEKTFRTEDAPQISDVNISSVGINFALIRFTSNRAQKVNIYYGKTNQFGGLQSVNTSTSESQSIFQLSNLEDGTKYFFKINAFDLDGFEYDGTILDFTTIPRPRISNVSIEEVKGTAQPTVKVNWQSNTEISSILTYYPSGNINLIQDLVLVVPTQIHELKLATLNANTQYTLQIRGIDKLGNEAVSQDYSFTTATDSRPPLIFNLNVETAVTNSTEENNAQIIISWSTDELATSQVVFGEGISSDLSQSSTEDRSLKFNHVIVVSNLRTSQVYTIKAVSRDTQRNETQSADNVTVTPTRSDSALEIILQNVTDIFGLN